MLHKVIWPGLWQLMTLQLDTRVAENYCRTIPVDECRLKLFLLHVGTFARLRRECISDWLIISDIMPNKTVCPFFGSIWRTMLFLGSPSPALLPHVPLHARDVRVLGRVFVTLTTREYVLFCVKAHAAVIMHAMAGHMLNAACKLSATFSSGWKGKHLYKFLVSNFNSWYYRIWMPQWLVEVVHTTLTTNVVLCKIITIYIIFIIYIVKLDCTLLNQ